MATTSRWAAQDAAEKTQFDKGRATGRKVDPDIAVESGTFAKVEPAPRRKLPQPTN